MSILKLTKAINELTRELKAEKQEVLFLTANNEALTLKLAVANDCLLQAKAIAEGIQGRLEHLTRENTDGT